MNITKRQIIAGWGVVVVLLGVIAIRTGAINVPFLGSAPNGNASVIAVTSFVDVGPTGNIVLRDPSVCSSRVVTTVAKAIMLNFSTSTSVATSTGRLSATKGHLQSASTTVAYDSGIYGCDYLAAYGFDSTTTITVSEFR